MWSAPGLRAALCGIVIVGEGCRAALLLKRAVRYAADLPFVSTTYQVLLAEERDPFISWVPLGLHRLLT